MPRNRQTQQNSQETTVRYVPIPREGSGVGFSRGTMVVNGVVQTAVRIWHPESSNGLTRYDTIEWQHPITGERRFSCNCTSWTRVTKAIRGCKHTEEMEDSPFLGISPDNSRRVSARPGPIAPVEAPKPATDGFQPLRRLDILACRTTLAVTRVIKYRYRPSRGNTN